MFAYLKGTKVGSFGYGSTPRLPYAAEKFWGILLYPDVDEKNRTRKSEKSEIALSVDKGLRRYEKEWLRPSHYNNDRGFASLDLVSVISLVMGAIPR